MLSSSSQSEVNLIEQVLQQGQKLRAAMVNSILSLDPFYSDFEPHKRMHSINMDEVNFEQSISTEEKHKFASYLRGDSMNPAEEKQALETFRAMSNSDICEVTEKSFESLQRNCRCETCVAYKKLEKFQDQETNKDCSLRNKGLSLREKDFPVRDLNASRESVEVFSSLHLKTLRFVDTLKVSVHSVKLGDEGWMKVCQGGKFEGAVTFFVEYEIPGVICRGSRRKGKVDSGLEASNFVRICSKKMGKEVIYFKQISIHDVSNLAETDLSKLEVKFKISSRSFRQKAMNVLGEAKFRLSSFYNTNYLSCNQDLVIFLENQAPIALGSLKVSLELGCGRLYYGKAFIDSISEGKENKVLPETVNIDTSQMKQVEKAKKFDSFEAVEPIKLTVKPKAKLREKKEIDKKMETNVKVAEKTILFGFIYVSQVEYLDVKLDTYFTCQPFCQDDTAYSNVVTSSSNPLFNFYQKIPFIYEETFLSKLRDNFMLFEFWHKVDCKESLVGVAKIPLHQYYLAFRNPTILKYLDRNQLPVIGTDWYEPISNPQTGQITGQAQILVALGSETQIHNLETERGFKDNIVTRAKRILDRPIRTQKNNKPTPITYELGSGSEVRGVSGRSLVAQKGKELGKSKRVEEGARGRSQELGETSKCLKDCSGSSADINSGLDGTRGRSQGDISAGNQPIRTEENLGQIKCILARDVTEIIISEDFTNRKLEEVSRKQEDLADRKLNETFSFPEVAKPETEKTFSEIGTQSNEVSVVTLDKSTNKVLTFDRACQSDTMDSDQSKTDVLGTLLQQLITNRPTSTTHEVSTNTDSTIHKNPAHNGPNSRTTDLLETLQKALVEPKDSFKAKVYIDSALHLPSRKKCKAKKVKGKVIREEILPSTYVTFDTCQDVKMTQIVHRNVNPKWEFSCDVSLPTDLLTSNQKRLIFKVWKKGRNGGQEPNQQVDTVLGFAALDLTVLLAGLPTVQGWFNILDFTSKCNGQIKISLTPLEEINKRNLTSTSTNTKTPTPISSIEPHCEPQESLSRALKRKFTELDEITQRLRSRLSHVTSNEESDTSNDECAEEFERDINTLCVEDDYDMIDFVREAQDMNLMRVSHSLQQLQQATEDAEDNQTLLLSSTTELSDNTDDVSSKSGDNSDLDKQLLEGKERIDNLLEKLTLGGFAGRFVSGCSNVGGSDVEVRGREEEILKELGIDREFDARGLFDSRVFGELGGVRHAPDGDAQ